MNSFSAVNYCYSE